MSLVVNTASSSQQSTTPQLATIAPKETYTNPNAASANPGRSSHHHRTVTAPSTTTSANSHHNNNPTNTTAVSTSTSTSASNGRSGSQPLVAQGDWTSNLVHLAKTAELKKHALTLQLHTAQILTSHALLESKNRQLQNIKEQKNKLESERSRLLQCLREVNEDRDKNDLLESSVAKECSEIQVKIQALTEGEYTVAKAAVDGLRAELGQPPMPSLQQTIDEKASAYLTDRRLNGNGNGNDIATSSPGGSGSGSVIASGSGGAFGGTGTGAGVGTKRTAAGNDLSLIDSPLSGNKRPRGRPKGSKNRSKGSFGGAGGGGGEHGTSNSP